MQTITVPGGNVPFLVDAPSAPSSTCVLAHGAGAGMEHEYMEAFARGLAERGSRVYRFNFLYVDKGKKAPDRQPVLEETYSAVVDAIRSDIVGPLILGGKSMGGRIASHIAAGGIQSDGLVFLGYPLHPPGRPDRIRDAHLSSVAAPMLFVEGTRDPFCPLDTLRGVLAQLGPRHDLVVIDDGDHSLKVRRSSGRSTPEAWAEAMDAIAGWISRL